MNKNRHILMKITNGNGIMRKSLERGTPMDSYMESSMNRL